jgi:outer membrane protein assembly factor BamC
VNFLSHSRLRAGLRASALVATVLSLGACASIGNFMGGDKVDYKSGASKPAPSLDVPPDLTQLSREPRFSVPGAPVSASRFEAGASTAASPAVTTAATRVGDIRIERAGNQRWLVINRPPEKLWDPVREFWQESGFLLNIDDQKLGILETDFAENRAKLPQDIIRRTIGRVFENLYSTGERDKFRTRLERTAEGTTEIYISHRGMIEVAQGSSGSTVWQPRAADAELEAEFLRRLMVRLGVPQAQANAAAPPALPPVARVTSAGNQPVLDIADGFDRAWRRVGLSLDRTGFTVEDRDRAQGLYFVRYVDPNTDQKDKGLLSRLFTGKAQPAPLKYRIALRSEANRTTVSVLDEQGQPDTSANAKRIVQVIADDLK